MANIISASALSTFTFEESHQIRIITKDNEPFFCLKDICAVLEIQNSRDLFAKQLDTKGVEKIYSPTAGGKQQLIYVNEPNLYRVIFRFNKPDALRFQDWVFDEVLPSIRKTGSYVQTISPAQQRAIQKLVADRVYASNLANTSMGFSAMYRALKDRFCIASYNQLPAIQFEEAVQFIADCPIETPKPTSEKLSPNDMSNIRRLLWAVSGQLNGGQSFVNMLWGCLREVTGRKSPSPFYVEDIPAIAKELKRIGEVLQPLSDAIYYAKKSAFRRLVKNREDVEKVMKEVKEQMNLDLLLKWKPSFMETEAFNCLLMRVKNPLPTSMEGYQEKLD